MTRWLVAVTAFILTGCQTAHEQTPGCCEEFTARITFYSNDKRYGNRIAADRYRRAKPFVTVAVDPKVIPYGTRLKIEGFDQVFVAEDTGSAVVSRKASLGKEPVIDIYVGTVANVNRLSVVYWQRYGGKHKVQILAERKYESGTSNGGTNPPSVTYLSLLKYPDTASGERR